MKSDDLLKDSVLYSSLCFQMLDFFEESYEAGNEHARALFSQFFDKKSFDYKDIAPLMRVPTTLGLLSSVVFFIKNQDITLSESSICNIKYDGKEVTNDLSHAEILRVIRNALAHWADNNSRNMLFNESAITFRSNNRRVEVSVPTGLHSLVLDAIRLSRLSMK